ncbi:hypothetical protein [Ideonella sp.]|jgi:hypothetical protein|uniref:hypothetical protein n=1 Tax=Ideonella sp. TaxID=1929293 RepID=UPI0037BF4C7F
MPAPLRLARPALSGLLLSCVLMSACAAPANKPPAAPASAATAVPAGAAALAQKVRDEIGDAACTSNSQCRTIGVGHRACGGPEAWLAWSTSGTNEAKLKPLVDAHTQARKAEVERSGMMSICAMLPDPGAQCVAQRCTLKTRGASPAVM